MSLPCFSGIVAGEAEVLSPWLSLLSWWSWWSTPIGAAFPSNPVPARDCIGRAELPKSCRNIAESVAQEGRSISRPRCKQKRTKLSTQSIRQLQMEIARYCSCARFLLRQGLWIEGLRIPPGQECSNGSLILLAVVLWRTFKIWRGAGASKS